MNTTAPLSEQHTIRRDEGAVSNFQATPQLAADLQQVLADLIEPHLQGKQAHWNVVGKNFRDLHLQLDELVDATREASDTIAERMRRALDAVPDGRSDTIVATTSLPQRVRPVVPPPGNGPSPARCAPKHLVKTCGGTESFNAG